MAIKTINGLEVSQTAEDIMVPKFGISLAEVIRQRLINIPIPWETIINTLQENVTSLINSDSHINNVEVACETDDTGEIHAEGAYNSGTLTITLYNIKGEKGDDGVNGTNGKSAYDIAVENGYVGTETEWLDSLRGEKGEPGTNGKDGKNGADGHVNVVNQVNPNDQTNAVTGKGVAAYVAEHGGSGDVDARVENGIDLKDMNFKLKKVIGNSFQRCPIISVNFNASVNDGFIIDWNSVKTNLTDTSSATHSTTKSYLDVSFDSTLRNKYLLYKLIRKRTNSNEYIKLHIDEWRDNDELCFGFFDNKGNFLIINLYKSYTFEDGAIMLSATRRSNNVTAQVDYPNFITGQDSTYKSDYKRILKKGDFDIEFVLFGTQIMFNVVKENITYPILSGKIVREDYALYNSLCEGNVDYYIGTSSFTKQAQIPRIYDLEFGLNSMWAAGADTKAVTNVDGSLFVKNNKFYICATAHGNSDLPTGGATNIYAIDCDSFKAEFIGVLNAKYNGYVDTLQSTSIRYNPNDGYWYIHGTNFGATASVISSGAFAVSYIGRTKKCPLGGSAIVDVQILQLPNTSNAFDFDFLYSAQDNKWYGVLLNGHCYEATNPLGSWTKTANGYKYNDGTEHYCEGAALTVVNGKLLYTYGAARVDNSPRIRDYATNEEIDFITKDYNVSSNESASPAWGNVFSIYANGISRYYLICFSERKIMGWNYGYGDIFIYEADEINSGKEFLI